MAGALWYVIESSYTCMTKLELTRRSSDRRRHWRLLLRQANPQRPRHFLDHTLVQNGRA
jgi:hypothetical protein